MTRDEVLAEAQDRLRLGLERDAAIARAERAEAAVATCREALSRIARGGGGWRTIAYDALDATKAAVADAIHMRETTEPCEVHDWPTDGLGRRLVDEMRARHGKGGINVCRECIVRARDDATRRVIAKNSAAR